MQALTASTESSMSKEGGSLKATILSCYDLPHDAQPSSVVLELLGSAVETGPPLARHKERNSFKFFGEVTNSNSAGPSNELVISSKLSLLYTSSATFRVKFSDPAVPDLIAQFQISRRLHVNETKWLILNLRPEGKNISEDDATTTSAPSTASTIPPTLRVKLLLTGPYRPEVSSLISLGNSYFRTIDNLMGQIEPVTKALTVDLPQNLPSAKYLLIPAVPVAVSILVLLPILLGIGIIGFPLFLPILVICIGVISGLSAVISALYFSTPQGREKMGTLLQPLYTTFQATETGQMMLYDVGARPSPKNLVKTILPRDMLGKLITSLALDFVGSMSYLLPLVGEAFDLVWAPIFAVIIAALYDDVMPYLKYFAFLEEILIFTDFIPSATIGWIKEFGPSIVDLGAKQVHNWSVVARREGAAFKNIRRN